MRPRRGKNLSVFLIHGKNQIDNKNILTLQEAMEQKILVVYETSNVNELMVENKSSQYEVFIQSGDIVKGGKQDRVLGVDIILPAKSGKISVETKSKCSRRNCSKKLFGLPKPQKANPLSFVFCPLSFVLSI